MLNSSSFLRKLTASALLGATALSLQSAVLTFKPNDGEGDPDDMLDLDHYKYFTWGFKDFQTRIPAGQRIWKASITIYDVDNWTADENGYWRNGIRYAENWLNVWLLDNIASNKANSGGLLKVYDDLDGSSDYFAGSGWAGNKTKLGTYTDWDGGRGHSQNVVFNFNQTAIVALRDYISAGNNFAIGVDPDCHYWNTGVKLIIETAPVYNVPETTASVGLLGMGLGFLALVRRRQRR